MRCHTSAMTLTIKLQLDFKLVACASVTVLLTYIILCGIYITSSTKPSTLIRKRLNCNSTGM